MKPDRENENAQVQLKWAAILVEELVRQGVGLFIMAPGSRCTPLVLAVAENERAKSLVHFDERGGAFAALGYARATGKPAALITTSGTAVANALPAVVEADADGVPLILLTADRPPELRDSGANQTIRQPGMFGPYVRWQFDMPVPELAIDPTFVLTTAGQAVNRTRSRPGPVHLNCMFREPFLAEAANEGESDWSDSINQWEEGEAPYTNHPDSTICVSQPEVESLAARLEGIEKGLVVLGQTDTSSDGIEAARFANALGWPLLADVTANCSSRNIAYDLVLASELFQDTYASEAVVHLGGKLTSKRLRQYIAKVKPRLNLVVRPDAKRFDPDHLVTERVQSDVSIFCAEMSEEFIPASGQSHWHQAWQRASDAAQGAIEDAFREGYLTEQSVANRLYALIPGGHGLVLASSMPIRNADVFGHGLNGVRVTANRGASGIDGTVATAAGFAQGLGHPTTLFTGDLALLHDLNSLALLNEGPPITVIVVNNDGGGIFHYLPIAEREEVFEAHFGTPHGFGFEQAASMFKLPYVRPNQMAEFEAAYQSAVESGRSSLIEIRTDRRASVEKHAELMALAAAAVERVLAT